MGRFVLLSCWRFFSLSGRGVPSAFSQDMSSAMIISTALHWTVIAFHGDTDTVPELLRDVSEML